MDAALQAINGAIQLIVPEVILIATVCVAFAISPFLVNDRGQSNPGLRNRWGVIALFGLLSAALVWWNTPHLTVTTGPFRIDELVWYTRLLSFGIGTVLVLVLWGQVEDSVSGECMACLLSILAGANLVASANDLISLFLALELVSIPTYVLLYLPRRDNASREATIKYFLLSVFSSGLMLFGMAYLFGVGGTTNLGGIQAKLASGLGDAAPLVVVALGMIIAGLGFRITAVPFHFYAPDVFQGTAPAAAGMLSIMPKIVGLVALFRVAQTVSWFSSSTGSTSIATIAGLAVITMFVGNLLALRQRNIARMMAYSSIAHAGYMLAGFAVIVPGALASGWGAVLFYLTTYGFATVGVFGILVAVSDSRKPSMTIDDFAGLSKSHPVAALLMAIVLFGLSGLPPTAGFLGKLSLFIAAWSQGTELGPWLAILMALNAAISAWYYLRLIATMYLQPNSQLGASQLQVPALVGSAICAVVTLATFVSPQWLWRMAEGVGKLVS